jgi:acyl carrier protein
MNLYAVVASTLKIDPSELNEQSNAKNTANWDSLRHIELMMSIESVYGVRFSLTEIAGMQNLGDMRSLLESKGVQFDAQQNIRQSA